MSNDDLFLRFDKLHLLDFVVVTIVGSTILALIRGCWRFALTGAAASSSTTARCKLTARLPSATRASESA